MKPPGPPQAVRKRLLPIHGQCGLCWPPLRTDQALLAAIIGKAGKENCNVHFVDRLPYDSLGERSVGTPPSTGRRRLVMQAHRVGPGWFDLQHACDTRCLLRYGRTDQSGLLHIGALDGSASIVGCVGRHNRRCIPTTVSVGKDKVFQFPLLPFKVGLVSER